MSQSANAIDNFSRLDGLIERARSRREASAAPSRLTESVGMAATSKPADNEQTEAMEHYQSAMTLLQGGGSDPLGGHEFDLDRVKKLLDLE